MKKFIFAIIAGIFVCSFSSAQIPTATLVKIVKSEDARVYDKSLDDLLKSLDPVIKTRAALAAGRIGNDAAIPTLISLLASDASSQVRTMAAFALGEIESVKAADAILSALRDQKTPDAVRARLVEAAGKIAAANPKSEQYKTFGEAILDTLQTEDKRGAKQNREVVRFAITAALRARPAETDFVVAKFLTNLDPRIRSDAANTLARVQAKNANDALRAMLLTDNDPNARANAARALGAAVDKTAFNLLLNAATEDDDSRVRVSAIRSLAAMKDIAAAEPLLEHGEMLLTAYRQTKKPTFIPNELSEFIEVAVTLGRLLTNTRNERAVNLFREFGKIDKGHSAEVYIARLRVSPGRGDNTEPPDLTHWRQYSTISQIVGEFASLEPTNDEDRKRKAEAPDILRPLAKTFLSDKLDSKTDAAVILAAPDTLRAFARFKTADLAELLREAIENKDVQIRATAASLLGDLPPSKENIEALKKAFSMAMASDKLENDAQLASLDALFKLNKREAIPLMWIASNAPDYLLRKRAIEYLKETQLDPALANVAVEGAVDPKKLHLKRYVSGSKLGQILNSDADYRRAIGRKNGTTKAVFTTEKGVFTIDFLPEEAPLTVDNFIKLARANYFNGLEVHRVVPNFVMQDGDPRGDGNGGPGWSIRCEVNMLEYGRGAVGMALSGKDTGGSQWFVTHAPQPHLDGGYTVFGQVNETGMKVVDNIVRGDKIISVKIVQGSSPPSTPRLRRKGR